MTLGLWHTALDRAQAISLGDIGLAKHGQFSKVFLLPQGLALKAIEVVQQRLDDQDEQQAKPKDDPSCEHERPLPLLHVVPAFSEALCHGFSTVSVIRKMT